MIFFLFILIKLQFQATELKSTSEHSHEADQFAITAMKVKAEIKASVQANRGRPGQIVADKLSSVPTEVWYIFVYIRSKACL